jgi:hypothetical protein
MDGQNIEKVKEPELAVLENTNVPHKIVLNLK